GPLRVPHVGRIAVPAGRIVRGVVVLVGEAVARPRVRNGLFRSRPIQLRQQGLPVSSGVDTLCATERPCLHAPARPQSPEQHARTEPPAPHSVSRSPLNHTKALTPLVALQPYALPPFTAAKLIHTLSRLHGRQIDVNLITGAADEELIQVGETL